MARGAGEKPMNENHGGAFYAPDTRNWFQRLLARTFPAKLAPRLEDKEGWAPGYMITEVVASLDWRDRLRVLVSGKVHVSTSTRTDVNVSKVHSETAVWVDAP
jgi:hypothetical protein